MNVKDAKYSIEQINRICNEANNYYEKYMDEAGFLVDAVAYLGDYRRMLEKAIEQAELPL